MSVEFQCPSCLKSLQYESGDTPFTTCYHCKGKIIVPSTVVNRVEIEDEKPTDFALREQKDLKVAEIQNELNAGRKISAIKVYRETFGTDLQSAKQAVENLERNGYLNVSKADLREHYSALQEHTTPTTSQNQLTRPAQSANPMQLIMTLIYIVIGIVVFYWLMG